MIFEEVLNTQLVLEKQNKKTFWHLIEHKQKIKQNKYKNVFSFSSSQSDFILQSIHAETKRFINQYKLLQDNDYSYFKDISQNDLIIINLTELVNEKLTDDFHQRMHKLLEFLDSKKCDYVIYYGYLGMEGHQSLYHPQGHVVQLKEINSATYLEHIYLSKSLAEILVNDPKEYQGALQPCFHQMFEAQANVNADNIALVWENQTITYKELNHKVNRLARWLLQQGVAQELKYQETLVTIYLDRGPQLIISLLAILKTGAAFLPLDANHERLSLSAAYERLKKSGSRFIITHDDLYEGLQREASRNSDTLLTAKINVDRDDVWCNKCAAALANTNINEQNLKRLILPNQLAYVMYTSGSTGEPKGVEICHRGLPYALMSHQDLLHLGNQDRVAQFASVGFDASIMEIMMALGCGGQLILTPEKAFEDIQQLKEIYQKNKVTAIIQTPKLLQELNPDDYPDLRAVLIVGEAFAKDLALKWLKRTGKSNRQVINGYGLTETTICSTLEEVNEIDELTIGTTVLGLIDDLRALDKEGQELLNEKVENQSKTNEARELYFAGPMVARGYWKKPELTKERFAPKLESLNPNSGKQNNDNQIFYKTGDVVKASARNKLSYIGRIDRQIKLRGQRLELDELEQRLKEYSEIIDARVVCHIDEKKNKQLAAYIVPKDMKYLTSYRNLINKETADFLRNIKEHLKKYMPGFMCPAITNMLLVEKLIRKDNDKKSPDDKAMKLRWVPPCVNLPLDLSQIKNITEQGRECLKIIKDVCLSVLNLPDPQAKLFSYEHDFYDWAGDSIRVNSFISRLKGQNYPEKLFQEVVQKLSVTDFNNEPTLFGVWKWYEHEVDKRQKEQKELYKDILKTTFKSTSESLMLLFNGITTDKFYNKFNVPFYCVHSLLGDAELDYQNSILNTLPTTIKLLSTPYSDAITIENKFYLDSLINHHLQTIRKSTPKGPYWLLGWSSGGVIALKLARKLRSEGERVFVFMLDSHHPQVMLDLECIKFRDNLIKLIKKVADAIKLLTSCDIQLNLIKISSELENISDKGIQIEKTFNFLRENIADIIQDKKENIDSNMVNRINKLIFSTEHIFKAELQDVNINPVLDQDTLLIIADKSLKKWPKNLGWQNADKSIILPSCSHFKIIKTEQIVKKIINPALREQFIDVKKPYYVDMSTIFNDDYEAAVKGYSQRIKSNERVTESYYGRAVALMNLDKYKEALQDFDIAYSQGFINELILSRRAWCYYQMGIDWYNISLNEYQAALKLNSDFAQAHRGIALIYNKLGNFQKSYDYYTRAFYLSDPDAEDYHNRGIACHELGRFHDAISDFSASIAKAPLHYKTFRERALSKLKLKQYDEAIADLDEALRINPLYYMGRMTKMLAYMLKGDKKSANKILESINVKGNSKALELLLNQIMPKKDYHTIAMSKFQKQDYQGALIEFDRIIQMDPENKLAIFFRAESKFFLNLFEESIQDYRIVTKLKPLQRDLCKSAYLNCADALSKLGRNEEALQELEAALALKLNSKEIFYMLGVILYRLNREEEALKYYDECIKLDANHQHALVNRGLIEFHLGKYQEALSDLNKGIELDKNDKIAYLTRARTFIKLGEDNDAIADLIKIIAIDKTDCKPHMLLAYIYNRLGQSEKLYEHIYHIIKLDSDLLSELTKKTGKNAQMIFNMFEQKHNSCSEILILFKQLCEQKYGTQFEENQDAIPDATLTAPAQDPKPLAHKEMYSLKHICLILEGLRKVKFNYHHSDKKSFPCKPGEEYNALRENKNHVLLLNPYILNNIAISLNDDIKKIAGLGDKKVLSNYQKWNEKPRIIIAILAAYDYWRSVRIELDYKQKHVKILWDDPRGINYFPMPLKIYLLEILKENFSILFGHKNFTVDEYDKKIEQLSPEKNIESNLVIMSNVEDYLETKHTTENFASAKARFCYTIKRHQDANYVSLVGAVKENHAKMYSSDESLSGQTKQQLSVNQDSHKLIREKIILDIKQNNNLTDIQEEISKWSEEKISALCERLEMMRFTRSDSQRIIINYPESEIRQVFANMTALNNSSNLKLLKQPF